MAQYIQKFQEGGSVGSTISEPEKEKEHDLSNFILSDGNYYSKKEVVNEFRKNFEYFIKEANVGKKDYEKYNQSFQEIVESLFDPESKIKNIGSRWITSFNPKYGEYSQLVLGILGKTVRSMEPHSFKKETEEKENKKEIIKTPYTNKGFGNKLLGIIFGEDFDEENGTIQSEAQKNWFELDSVNENGFRGTEHRLSKIKKATNIFLDKYFNTYSFASEEDKNETRQQIENFRNSLDGGLTSEEKFDAAQFGLSNMINSLLATTFKKKDEKPYKTNKYVENYLKLHPGAFDDLTNDQIKEYVDAITEAGQQKIKKDILSMKSQNEKLRFEEDKKYDFSKIDQTIVKYKEFKGDINEIKALFADFKKSTNKELLNKLKNTDFASGLAKLFGRDDFSYVDYLTKINNNENKYIINKSLDLEDGSAIIFDKDNKKFYKTYIKKDSTLYNMLFDEWRKQKLIPQNKNGSKIQLLRSFQSGGKQNIFTKEDSLLLDLFENNLIDNTVESNDSINKATAKFFNVEENEVTPEMNKKFIHFADATSSLSGHERYRLIESLANAASSINSIISNGPISNTIDAGVSGVSLVAGTINDLADENTDWLNTISNSLGRIGNTATSILPIFPGGEIANKGLKTRILYKSLQGLLGLMNTSKIGSAIWDTFTDDQSKAFSKLLQNASILYKKMNKDTRSVFEKDLEFQELSPYEWQQVANGLMSLAAAFRIGANYRKAKKDIKKYNEQYKNQNNEKIFYYVKEDGETAVISKDQINALKSNAKQAKNGKDENSKAEGRNAVEAILKKIGVDDINEVDRVINNSRDGFSSFLNKDLIKSEKRGVDFFIPIHSNSKIEKRYIENLRNKIMFDKKSRIEFVKGDYPVKINNKYYKTIEDALSNKNPKIIQNSNGGIIKAQNGTNTDWFKSLAGLINLPGYNRQRKQHSDKTLNKNITHNPEQDKLFQSVYDSNKAYIENKNAISQDLNEAYKYFISENENGSASDFVTWYNNNADKIRNSFSDNNKDNYKAGNENWADHNKLHKILFKNRNNQSIVIDGYKNPGYNLGYDANQENILGSTTNQRRMDLYEKKYNDLSEQEKKDRQHSISDGKFVVYKKQNGDIGLIEVKNEDPGVKPEIKPEDKTQNESTPTIDTYEIDPDKKIEEQEKKSKRLYNLFSATQNLMPSALEYASFIANLKNNRRVFNKMSEQRPSLKTYYNSFRNLFDLAPLVWSTQNKANEAMSQASKATTSDANINNAKRLDTAIKVNDAVSDAERNSYNQALTTNDRQIQEKSKNNQYNLGVRDFNVKSLVDHLNYLKRLHASYYSAQQTNLDNLLKSKQLGLHQMNQYRNNIEDQMFDLETTEKLRTDAKYNELLKKAKDNPEDLTAQQNLQNYMNSYLYKRKTEILRRSANRLGFPFKKGGKISKKEKEKDYKKFEKDLDRLAKQIMFSIKTVQDSIGKTLSKK